MSETKRTPGKWGIPKFTEEIEIWSEFEQVKKDCYTQTIGTRVCGDFDNARDADYICRAVNCHERLVEAAREFHEEIDNLSAAPRALRFQWRSEIAALIAEAEGGGNG